MVKFSPLSTYGLSVFLAALTAAEPNCCFQNAWEIISALPHLDATYVEGWLVLAWEDAILVIEHGWACLPDARILDPSIIFLVGPKEPLASFAGVTSTPQEALAFRGEMLPRVCTTHGPDGMGHPEYKAAYDQALRLAQSLASQTRPHRRVIIQRAIIVSDRPGRHRLL
ncbi:MAG TPA: hypothetical protein VFV38_18865 [Ktedonobacteraceae bacterium]|nr:hypothetical protein [Ktedonobacteraceae bacterium]